MTDSPTHPHKRDAFVIMPFSTTKSCSENQWTEIYEDVFQTAVEDCGLQCGRAEVGTGSLIKSIVERLRDAYIVLADITDANPNVFYELGVRHSLSKRTILLAQGAKHIPSDLRGYWSLIYGTSPKKVATFKSDLKRIIERIDSDPEKSDSPVSDYLDRENVAISRDAHIQNLRKLGALFTELTGNALVVSELSNNSDALPLASYGCLTLLLETLYVDPGPGVLKRAYELRKCLQLIERGNLGSILPVATKTLKQLMLDVEAIRNKVASGSLDEPPNPTMMQWVPGFGLPSDIPLPASYMGGDDVLLSGHGGLCAQAAAFMVLSCCDSAVAPPSENSDHENQDKR